MKAFLTAFLFFALSASHSQTAIVGWNFNANFAPLSTNSAYLLPTSYGSGTFKLVGFTSAIAGSGSPQDTSAPPNNALYITDFPAQGTANKSAGVELTCYGMGYHDFKVNFEHKNGNTAPNTFTIQLLVRNQWKDVGSVAVAASDTNTWATKTVLIPDSLISEPSMNIRIVVGFEGIGNVYKATATDSAYSRTGVIALDKINVTALPYDCSVNTPVALPFYYGRSLLSWNCAYTQPSPPVNRAPIWYKTGTYIGAGSSCSPTYQNPCTAVVPNIYLPKVLLTADRQYRFRYKYWLWQPVQGNNIMNRASGWVNCFISSDTTTASIVANLNSPSLLDSFRRISSSFFTPTLTQGYHWGASFHSTNINFDFNTNETNFYGPMLDDISIEETNDCSIPTCLLVSTSDTSLKTAVFKWQPQPGDASYDWELRTKGESGTGAEGLIANGTTTQLQVSLSNLNPNTIYYAYVRSNCTSGLQSLWSDPYLYKSTFADDWFSARPTVMLPYNVNVNYTPLPVKDLLFTRPTAGNPCMASNPVVGDSNEDVWFKFIATDPNAIMQVLYYFPGNPPQVLFGDLLMYKIYKAIPNGLQSNFIDSGKVAFLTNPFTLTSNGQSTTTTHLPYEDFSAETLLKNLVVGEEYYIRLSTANPRYRKATFNVGFYKPDVSMGIANRTITGIAQAITPANGNASQWVNLSDSARKMIVSINANGSDLGSVRAAIYKNTGTIRQDAKGLKYLDRNIQITVAKQPISPVTVRIYLAQAEIDAYTVATGYTFNDLNITKNSDSIGSGIINGGSIIIPTGRGIYGAFKYLEFEVSSFSSFYIHGGSVALPITFTDFTVSKRDGAASLFWQIHESGVRSFEVQRSFDNGVFESVGIVASKNSNGTSTELNTYIYNDRLFEKTVYYRLKIISADGNFSYSKTVVLLSGNESAFSNIRLYPNPAKEFIWLDIDAKKAGNVSISITDATGRVIEKQIQKCSAGKNKLRLNVNYLANGLYWLSFRNNENRLFGYYKFVK